jgi:hypothetical protein
MRKGGGRDEKCAASDAPTEGARLSQTALSRRIDKLERAARAEVPGVRA